MKKLVLFVFITSILVQVHTIRADAAGNKYKIADYEVNVLRVANVLRYDFVLTNNNPEQTSRPSYRGHYYHSQPIEIAVLPGKKLSSVMKQVPKSTVSKMVPAGGSSNGDLRTQKRVLFSAEYQINKNSDLKDVKKFASNGTLIIFDGVKEVAEIPLPN